MLSRNSECSVALSYVLGNKVPIIIASGKGDISKQIKKIAREHNIDIVKNSELASVLSQAEIGSCIPQNTYLAVASIFAFLINKKELNNVKKN